MKKSVKPEIIYVVAICLILIGCDNPHTALQKTSTSLAQATNGMAEVDVIAILGSPQGSIIAKNRTSFFYPECTIEFLDGQVVKVSKVQAVPEYHEKPVSYKGNLVSRAERDRLMCRELRKQGRLGGKNRIVVVNGKIIEFAKNERFISPFDEEGVKEYHADDPLIHRAVLDGNVKLVKLLLFINPSLLHKHNQAKAEPLHSAAYSGNLELVKMLIERGADVDSENTRGCTPLFSAAFGGHNDVVDYLIRHGANVNHKDNYDFTAMDGTYRFELNETINLLKRHGSR